MTRALRKAVVAAGVALLPAAGMIGAAGVADAAATPNASYANSYAAPYLEISNSDVGDMAADMQATGTKYYTLAFLIPKSGCTAQWENGNYAVGSFKSQISALQAAGGNVIISFGGAAGGELAKTCTSATSLQAAYANIVNTYNVKRLDFDIEGGPLDDTASISRRDTALAALQKADPSVQVDYTLPVASNGLESNAQNLLKDAKSKGVKVNLVNIMTMDFGDGENAYNDAISGANATHGQLASIYSGTTSAQQWHMIGLTPIAGKNDDNENFTQGNATSLESFAASKGVQELSFWEVDGYDKKVGYAYSKTFNKITG
jgi:chitinase